MVDLLRFFKVSNLIMGMAKTYVVLLVASGVVVGYCPDFARARGFETESGHFRLSGFGTLGVTFSDNEELGFYRDLSQDESVFKGELSFLTDSLLGVQVDSKFTPTLDATLQIVLKERAGDDFIDNIEQAFLRYNVLPPITARIGRLPIVYMLADYRNVGFAYLWARPPVELYGRIPFNVLDGIDVSYVTPINQDTFYLKLFGGKVDFTTTYGTGEVNDFELSPVAGITLNYETDQWSIRCGYVYTESDGGLVASAEQLRLTLVNIPEVVWPGVSAVADDLDIEGQSIGYYSLGVSYDSNSWLIQSEIAYLDSKISTQPNEIDAYLSVGHRFGPVTPYIVASIAEPMDDIREVSDPMPVDPMLQLLQEQVSVVYNANRADQHTLSLGVKWDFRQNANLKLQWDRTWVKGDGAVLWKRKDNFDGKDKIVNTIALNFNFIF